MQVDLSHLPNAPFVRGAADAHYLPCSRTRSTLERMPKWLICVPLVIQWLWLSLRYRSLTLPSAANPAITSGGLVGDGKLEYFFSMGRAAQAATARYCAVRAAAVTSRATLRLSMRKARLFFPVIAKPDLGLCGFGVRLVADMGELQRYLSAFPVGEMVVLQQYLPYDGEAGIFYVRNPLTNCGHIIGLALRYFPRVEGDGIHSLSELVARDPRARRAMSSALHECAFDAGRIPSANEVVRLSTIGSTRVGGLYRNGNVFITPELTQAVDAIARDMSDFYFGRFDVRFEKLGALSAGHGFSIMEVNGAGSEAIEAWDPDIGLVQGLRMIFRKQAILFAVADCMRQRGVRPIGLLKLVKLNLRQHRLIARYPPSN